MQFKISVCKQQLDLWNKKSVKDGKLRIEMNLAVNNEKGTFSLTLRLKYDEIPGRGPWNCCWSQTRLTGLSYKAQPVFSSNKKYSVPDLTGPRGQKVDDNNQKVRQSALPADMSSWISLNTANLGVGSRRVMGLNVWQLLERNYKTQRPNIEDLLRNVIKVSLEH